MKYNSYIAPIIFILIGLTCMIYSLASASGFHIHSNLCIWFKECFPPLILLIVITIFLIYIWLLKRRKQIKKKQK
ncbi:hypothetical protein C1N68_26285 (plasmid) [Priestia aryabhattai]